MRFRIFTLILIAMMSTTLHAQQPAGGQAPDPNADPKDQTNGGAMPGVVTIRMGGGGGGMMFRATAGGPMGMGGDELSGVLHTLGDLNLSTAFNLSNEQKQKIQAIRDDFKKASDAWHKDHADELKQLDDATREMFDNMQNGGPPDPGQMEELNQQRMQLMDSAPNGEEQVTALKAVLTDDQRKQLEAKQAEEEKEREEAMSHMPMRFGPPGGHRDHQNHDADKDKDKDKSKDADKDSEKDKGR